MRRGTVQIQTNHAPDTIHAAPYTITWQKVPQGNYSLTARATDDRGGSTTSAAITVRVRRK